VAPTARLAQADTTKGHARRERQSSAPNARDGASGSRGRHLVSPATFVLATRDSGYRSTPLAVAEFVDNALQAGATSVAVNVVVTGIHSDPIELLVIDNGHGMDEPTLASALTFGGSSRFGDRSSLGRFGMGLPNGALSRARRVDVYTWQRAKADVLTARLDIDEIVAGKRRTLPPIERVARPVFVPASSHGTAVRLRRCDRLEYRRPNALTQKLSAELGRIYRKFLTNGFDLRINGQKVSPVDPMHLIASSNEGRAKQFGDTITYELSNAETTGVVSIKFSELPVDRWHSLPATQKKQLDVTSAPCVSVLRADREIDRGWYFMGAKRRENYDDWWRCEVTFEPVLDELFGITHSKQGISPSAELLATLAPDLEPIARALNTRVRRQFELVKATTPLSAAEKQAAKVDRSLPPLPKRKDEVTDELRKLLEREVVANGSVGPYRISIVELPTTAAYEVIMKKDYLALLLNSRHPFYRDLYGPLAASDSSRDQDVAKHLALTILAAARAEAGATRQAGREEVRRFRQDWADVLATFYNA
jgi:hypothetical protein